MNYGKFIDKSETALTGLRMPLLTACKFKFASYVARARIQIQSYELVLPDYCRVHSRMRAIHYYFEVLTWCDTIDAIVRTCCTRIVGTRVRYVPFGAPRRGASDLDLPVSIARSRPAARGLTAGHLLGTNSERVTGACPSEVR
eukprot:SAG31_NODE_1086_length_9998_cov_2.389837_8_plen_143_part_00